MLVLLGSCCTDINEDDLRWTGSGAAVLCPEFSVLKQLGEAAMRIGGSALVDSFLAAVAAGDLEGQRRTRNELLAHLDSILVEVQGQQGRALGLFKVSHGKGDLTFVLVVRPDMWGPANDRQPLTSSNARRWYKWRTADGQPSYPYVNPEGGEVRQLLHPLARNHFVRLSTALQNEAAFHANLMGIIGHGLLVLHHSGLHFVEAALEQLVQGVAVPHVPQPGDALRFALSINSARPQPSAAAAGMA